MNKEATANEAIRVGEEWVQRHHRNGSWTLTESEWDTLMREVNKLVLDVALRAIAPEKPSNLVTLAPNAADFSQAAMAAKLVEAQEEIARLRAVELAADALADAADCTVPDGGELPLEGYIAQIEGRIAAYRLAKSGKGEPPARGDGGE